MRTKYWIIIILGLSIAVSSILYFITFHSGISSNPNDWMAFGNYFAGIASLLNVIVFTWLTIVINTADEKTKLRDRQHQATIIKSQLRYDELKWLIAQFNMVYQADVPSMIKYGKLADISFSVNSFMQSRSRLFPILNEESIQRKFLQMCVILNDISVILRNSAGLDENGIPVREPDKLITSEYKKKLSDFHSLRNELINILESYILEDLQKQR